MTVIHCLLTIASYAMDHDPPRVSDRDHDECD
jgi:hypothetical protein